jgi:alanine-alpha-ketoisovalerate/valine-pyruvate aminotransferase
MNSISRLSNQGGRSGDEELIDRGASRRRRRVGKKTRAIKKMNRNLDGETSAIYFYIQELFNDRNLDALL